MSFGGYPENGPSQSNPLAADSGGTGITDSGTDNTKALMSDGAHGFVMAVPAGGGGASSKVVPPSQVTLSTIQNQAEVVASTDGAHIYVSGTLISNSHGAVLKIDTSTGTVSGTCDLGASVPALQGMILSQDGSTLYAVDTTNATWKKISTSNMTVSQSVSTTAAALPVGVDLSPDGTRYAFVNGADDNVYFINTGTGAVTNFAAGNSSSGAFTSAVAFDNTGANVYVAYNSVGLVDLYSVGGAYGSTLPSAGSFVGNFNIISLKSGPNGTLFAADVNLGIEFVASGQWQSIPLFSLGNGSTNGFVAGRGKLHTVAAGTIDMCLGGSVVTPSNGAACPTITDSSQWQVTPIGMPAAVQVPYQAVIAGYSDACFIPDGSGRVIVLNSATQPAGIWITAGYSQILPKLVPVSNGGTGNNNFQIHSIVVGHDSISLRSVQPANAGIVNYTDLISDPRITGGTGAVSLSAGVMAVGTLSLGNGGTGQTTLSAARGSAGLGIFTCAPVGCATTANITLSGNQTIDTVTTTTGMRVLVKNQSTASQNGIYVASSGAWSRATDMATSVTDARGMMTFCTAGSTNLNHMFIVNGASAVVPGTSSMTWQQAF